jgi:hypothetical protein
MHIALTPVYIGVAVGVFIVTTAIFFVILGRQQGPL